MADQVALEQMRATPVVEIPVLSKIKRKRTSSLDEMSPHRSHQAKKARPAEVATTRLPSPVNIQPVTKLEAAQTVMQAATTSHSGTEANHAEILRSNHDLALSTDSHVDANPSLPHMDTQPAIPVNEDVPMLDTDADIEIDGLTKLQEVIANELNMQILMKHNELRVIEQELAKCQVGLEQLRRVELQPYPGSSGLSEAVSSGSGASVEPAPGYTRPAYPAPYGVTDGPYTRHYNQWLLQDPQFDSTPIQHQLYLDSMAGRSTRNSGSVRKSISKPFTFPARPNENLQSIPNYPAPPVKDKSAPLILKRSTDNQFVKLICNNCLRGNFSSIQGFLNHCRIAHKVDYKSHDAAAIDCGRVLEEHEAASIPAEPVQNTPSHKPTLSRISTAAPTPHRNLVHPLNTTVGAAAPPNDGSKRKPAKRASVPSLASGAYASADAKFVASSQAPRLSAQFAKYQRGGDLAAAVLGAKQKVDLSVDDDMLTPEASDQGSPFETTPWSSTSEVGRSGMTIPGGRPPSHKGVRPQQRQLNIPTPLTPADFEHSSSSLAMKQEDHSEIPESPQYPPSHHSTATYSPHTADSNPGLVSDHEDEDDHGSASEEEGAPPTHMPRPFAVGAGTGCADNMDIEVAEDGDDDHIIIRREALYGDETGLRGAGSPSRKLGLGKRGV